MKDFLEGIGKTALLKIGGTVGGVLIIIFIIFIAVSTVSLKGGHDQSNQTGGMTTGGAVCNITGQIDDAKFNGMVARAGVISTKGEVIKQVAKDEGIDPVLMLAIIITETGGGKSRAVIEHNNPAGLMDGSRIRHYATLDDGLKAQGRTLHNLIIGRQLFTIEKLGAVYSPVGADNDPFGTNGEWIPMVTSFVKQAGGLTMNCTASDNAGGINGNVAVGENGKMNYFDAVIKEMLQYEGWPYVWAGANPNTGFDCSGLMQWNFSKVGIKLPRTAIEQYKYTERIDPKDVMVGDLIFFKGTYGGPNHISHVGIYVGDGKMYDSNSKGIGYHNMTDAYWQQHFAGFGRIKG